MRVENTALSLGLVANTALVPAVVRLLHGTLITVAHSLHVQG